MRALAVPFEVRVLLERSSAGPPSTAPPRDAGYATRPPAKPRTNCSPRRSSTSCTPSALHRRHAGAHLLPEIRIVEFHASQRRRCQRLTVISHYRFRRAEAPLLGTCRSSVVMPRNPSPYGGPSPSRGQGAHTEARSRAEESWGAVSCPTRTKLRGVVFENRLVAGAIGHREDAGENHASLGGLGAGAVDGGDHGLVTVCVGSATSSGTLGVLELMGLHGGCLACGGWAQVPSVLALPIDRLACART